MNSTISLGEVFHRVAYSIHKDLTDVVEMSAKSKDPEINTIAMVSFVSRTRRKLLQLLATVKWLSTPRTKRIIDALDTYYFNLQDFERRCEAATGEMFFVHSRIFSMRSPRPLIEDAMTLMTAKRVRGSLPPAVFQSGRREYPRIEEDFMKQFSSVVKMKLFREKLNLVLNDVVKGSLRDGVLAIAYGNLFTLSCTLLTSSLESSWRALAYNIIGSPGYEKYWKRRGEEVQEFLQGERVQNCPTLRSLINRAHHNALLCRLADICDQVKQSIKSLQPMQVIQDVRKGLQASNCVFGFWKSEYSSQYQLHFVFAVDHIELENEETFAPLLISVTTVTDEDYRVDYTMSNLSEVTSPLKSVEHLRSLILQGTSVHELSLALVQPIVDLKLQYLLRRLPSFPQNMNVRYERQGQSLLLFSGSYSIALQLDAITGRFYFNSSKSEALHGNLERFLLEVNSVETEHDFLAYYTATLHGDPETMASEFTFRPLTTADLVVAYLKTMDLDSSLLISSCQRVTPQEDRSLQFQVQSQTLFAKYWRRRFWIQANELHGQGADADATMDFGENASHAAGNNDDHSISTGGASLTLTRATATTGSQRSRRHQRKFANRVVWMMYYGYIVRADFSVTLTVSLKRLFLQTKQHRLVDMEHIDSVEFALSPDHLLRSDTDILGQWVQLEQSVWNNVERHMCSDASVPLPFLSEPQLVGYSAIPSEKAPLLIHLKSIVSKACGSGNLALWPLRSEQKELSLALVRPLNGNPTGNTIDVFFVSASSAASLLNIDLSSSKQAADVQSLLTTQSGSPIYAPAKLFASLSLQLFRHVDVVSSQATVSQRFRLASLQLFHRYVTDTDEAVRTDKLERCQNHVTKAIRCIIHHYRQAADTPCRLQDIQPMVLTIRAVILFCAICLMDLHQVKAYWSFAKHELLWLSAHIQESTLVWSFRWNQGQQSDDNGGSGGEATTTKSPSASKALLGYMSARLVLPDDRKVVPVITFIDLRHNRQLQLSVEDMSLVNVADFFNMDRFDDS